MIVINKNVKLKFIGDYLIIYFDVEIPWYLVRIDTFSIYIKNFYNIKRLYIYHIMKIIPNISRKFGISNKIKSYSSYIIQKY